MKWFIAVAAVAVFAACANAQTRFQDKIVLVTGGSSGIGYQTALQFAQEGAHVIICARDSDTAHYSGDAAVEAINNDETVKQNHGFARFVKADVSKEDDVAHLFADIREKEGYLDIAVNNAGISGPVGHLLETVQYTVTAHDPIVNNLYGVIRCIGEEEALFMEKSINGSIVSVSAIEGITPASNMPRYSAAAHAIVGLTKSVAMNHITGEDGVYIRANVVCPGRTATPFAFNLVKEKDQPWEGEWVTEDSDTWKNALPSVVEHIPMARVARPNEIANTILWLCTEDADYISGDTLTVDGGVWAA